MILGSRHAPCPTAATWLCPHRRVVALAVLLAAVALPALALAQTGAPVAPQGATGPLPWSDASVYEASAKALTLLFVLAVLLESALSVIFNWRPFRRTFAGKGVKTPVMVVLALLLVWNFDIDVLPKLLSSYGITSPESDVLTKSITALVIAGGSAGVYRLLVALGYRQRATETEPEIAWVAVRVHRHRAVGPIHVHLTPGSETGADATAASSSAIAAVLQPTSRRQILRETFLANPDRFPTSGGWRVDSDKVYHLAVKAKDADGKDLPSRIDGTYRFARGAIIDFDVAL